MNQSLDLYEQMNREYQKVLPYTMKKFIREIGLEKINNRFKKVTKKSLLYKHIKNHYKKNLKEYITTDNYFNPIEYLKNSTIKNVNYDNDGFALYLKYYDVDFVCTFSQQEQSTEIAMVLDSSLYRPFVLHPEAIVLLERILFEYAVHLIQAFEKHKKHILFTKDSLLL